MLSCDSPDWCLKNKEPLLFKMLYAMDGNNSLQHVLRWSSSGDDDEILGPLCEHQNFQQVPGDHYLSRDYVDKWATRVLQEMMGVDPGAVGGFTDQIT